MSTNSMTAYLSNVDCRTVLLLVEINVKGQHCFIVPVPLLISTGFLKYPLELKKKSVRTEKKIQLVYN